MRTLLIPFEPHEIVICKGSDLIGEVFFDSRLEVNLALKILLSMSSTLKRASPFHLLTYCLPLSTILMKESRKLDAFFLIPEVILLILFSMTFLIL